MLVCIDSMPFHFLLGNPPTGFLLQDLSTKDTGDSICNIKVLLVLGEAEIESSCSESELLASVFMLFLTRTNESICLLYFCTLPVALPLLDLSAFIV